MTDLPLLTDPTATDITYVEDGVLPPLMRGVTLSDPGAVYAGGSFTFAVGTTPCGIVLAGDATVRVVNSAGQQVLVNGNGFIIGTVTGYGTPTMTVGELTSIATPNTLQTVLNSFIAVLPGQRPAAGDFAVSLTLTLADGRTDSVGQTLEVISVDDPALAYPDTFATDELGGATLDVLRNDSDVDGPAMAIERINGISVVTGEPIALDSGATLTLRADGGIDYATNHAFDHLCAGETAVEQFTYSLAGGNTATVTINVAGVGDAAINGTAGDDGLAGTDGDDAWNLSQGGSDRVVGGRGDDTIHLGATFARGDRINGGGDSDTVTLAGDYALRITGDMLRNVERVQLETGLPAVPGGFSYTLSTVDATVAANTTLVIDGARLSRPETLRFDGRDETDGRFDVRGGSGDDVIRTGAGNDTLDGGDWNDLMAGGAGDDTYHVNSYGDRIIERAGEGYDSIATTLGTYKLEAGLEALVYVGPETFTGRGNAANNAISGGSGGDVLHGMAGDDSLFGNEGDDVLHGGTGGDEMMGGGGADTFVISRGDSTGTARDVLRGANFANDRIDVDGRTARYHRDADVAEAALDEASFDADLARMLDGLLTARGVSLVGAAGGDLAGRQFLVIDQDGVDGYAAGVDLVIDVTGAQNLPAAGVEFLI